MTAQPAIVSGVPAHASFLFLNLRKGADAAGALAQLADSVLAEHVLAEHVLVGLGSSLLSAFDAQVPGMRPMPALVAHGLAAPCTPADLFLRIAGDDPGQVLLRERALLAALPAFALADRVDGFMHADSRDLSGYEDGTENPTGNRMAEVALQQGAPGLAGSSVIAVQRWVHDMDALAAMSKDQTDSRIGRDRVSNEELEDAPTSAHVKRAAQEDFDPEAWLLRRSMPWRDHRGAGLVFVALAASLDPFEAVLRRMMGLDDGIVDGLYGFTRPVTGASFWCPPVVDGHLDLRAVEQR